MVEREEGWMTENKQGMKNLERRRRWSGGAEENYFFTFFFFHLASPISLVLHAFVAYSFSV